MVANSVLFPSYGIFYVLQTWCTRVLSVWALTLVSTVIQYFIPCGTYHSKYSYNRT